MLIYGDNNYNIVWQWRLEDSSKDNTKKII